MMQKISRYLTLSYRMSLMFWWTYLSTLNKMENVWMDFLRLYISTYILNAP